MASVQVWHDQMNFHDMYNSCKNSKEIPQEAKPQASKHGFGDGDPSSTNMNAQPCAQTLE